MTGFYFLMMLIIKNGGTTSTLVILQGGIFEILGGAREKYGTFGLSYF
jgi:hypothetical protein